MKNIKNIRIIQEVTGYHDSSSTEYLKLLEQKHDILACKDNEGRAYLECNKL